MLSIRKSFLCSRTLTLLLYGCYTARIILLLKIVSIILLDSDLICTLGGFWSYHFGIGLSLRPKKMEKKKGGRLTIFQRVMMNVHII